MKDEELFNRIKPYIAGMVNGSRSYGAGSAGALLSNGSVPLVGNLTVDVGVTIDGVDLSAHYTSFLNHVANPNAHHLAYTGNHLASGAVVPNGAGSIGLIEDDGMLVFQSGSNAVKFSVDETVVRIWRKVESGAGLTGGGDLSTDRYLTLGLPSSVSAQSHNAVGEDTHSHEVVASYNPDVISVLLKTSDAGHLFLNHIFRVATDLLDVNGDTGRVGIGISASSAAHLDILNETTSSAVRIRTGGIHHTPLNPTLFVESESTYDVSLVRFRAPNVTGVPLLDIEGEVSGGYEQGMGIALREVGGAFHRLVLYNSGQIAFGPGDATRDVYFNRDPVNPETMRITNDGLTGPGNLLILGKLGVGLNDLPTGPQVEFLNQTTQLRLSYDGAYHADFEVGGGGNLTLRPMGDLILDPTGNDVLPAQGYDISLGSIQNKWLMLHAAELWVETLVAQDTAATIGGRVLVGPTTSLTADISNSITTILVKHNQMSVGDVAYMEAAGQVEFIRITAGPTGSGPYSYTVTRSLDASGSNAWPAGTAVFNTGQAGQGFIDLYSLSGVTASSPQYLFNFHGGAFSANHALDTEWRLFREDGGVPDSGDAIYAGQGNATWQHLYFWLKKVAVYGFEDALLRFEYWDGVAWTELPSTLVPDIGEIFTQESQSLEWDIPEDWSKKVVNGIDAYWVRIIIDALYAWEAGVSNGGRRVSTSRRTYGPTIAMNVRNSNDYNDWTEHVAIGNLSGTYDYGVDTYGAAFGKYSSAGGTTPWIGADDQHGIRVMRGSEQLARWDLNGDILIGQELPGQNNILITAGHTLLRNYDVEMIRLDATGYVLIGSGAASNANVYADGSSVLLRTGSVPKISLYADGSSWFEGVMNIGPYGAITQSAVGDFASPWDTFRLYNVGGMGVMEFWGGGIKQVYTQNDGKLYAGDGNVRLDSNGIAVSAVPTSYSANGYPLIDSANAYTSEYGNLLVSKWGTGVIGTDLSSAMVVGSNSTQANLFSIAAHSPTWGFSRLTLEAMHSDGSSGRTSIILDSHYAGVANPLIRITAGSTGNVNINNNLAVFSQTQLTISGILAVSSNISALRIYTSDFYRSIGNSGWYNETYGGGVYQFTSGWVDAYGTSGFRSQGGGLSIAGTSTLGAVNGSGLATFTGGLIGNRNTFLSSNNGSGQISLYSSIGDPFLAFNRGDVYGAQFGLDSTNNFTTKGWSAGAGYTGLRVGNTSISGLLYVGYNVDAGYYGSLQHSGIAGNFHFDTNGTGAIFLNWFSGSGGVQVGNGTSGGYGPVYASSYPGPSSLRFKEDIQDLTYGWDDLVSLRGVSYVYIWERGHRRLGFIAEEVLPKVPEVVVLDSQGRPSSLNYQDLIPVVVSGVVDRDRQNARRFESLESELSELRGMLREMREALRDKEK